MARVSLVITARDMTADAFRRIDARARRLDRSFTRRATGAGPDRDPSMSLFRVMGRGLARLPGRVRSAFRSTPGIISRAFAGGFRHIPGHLARGVRRGVTGVFGAFGRLAAGLATRVAGAFRGGFFSGLSSALKGGLSNPYIASALAVLAVGIAGLLGAAIAGALVFAFGAAFVGLAGFIAAQSPKVKKAWSGMVEDVKMAWADAGKSMEPVITHGIGLLRKLSDAFLPHFKEAMAGAAGPVQSFLDKFAESITVFGKKAFHPMMEGFSALLEALGPEFVSLFGSMGDSFAALGNTVKTHSGEIAMAMGIVLRAIGAIIDIINFLAQVWVGTLRVITAGFGYLIKYGVRTLSDALLLMARDAVMVLAKAFGWVPGLGGKLRSAQKAVEGFKDKTYKNLTKLGDAAINWGKDMDRANRKRILKVDIGKWTKELAAAKSDLKKTLSTKAIKKLQMQIKDWTDKLAKARRDLKKTTSTKAKAKLEGTIADLEKKIKRAKTLLVQQSHRKSKSKILADISNLQRQIASARRQLNALNGKTAKTYVTTYYSQVRNKGYAGNSATGGKRTGGIVGMAHGGISRATASTRGVMVGEDGPEWVNLPPGSRVRTAGATRAAQGGGAAGRLAANLIFKSSGRRVDDLLLEILREAIHQRGGNPVKVLGG